MVSVLSSPLLNITPNHSTLSLRLTRRAPGKRKLLTSSTWTEHSMFWAGITHPISFPRTVPWWPSNPCVQITPIFPQLHVHPKKGSGTDLLLQLITQLYLPPRCLPSPQIPTRRCQQWSSDDLLLSWVNFPLKSGPQNSKPRTQGCSGRTVRRAELKYL